MITNEDARRGCTPFGNADLCGEEASDLFTAAPTEGADRAPGGSTDSAPASNRRWWYEPSRRASPAHYLRALILSEPAQRLEKDRAGQVLGHSGIADLVGDKALEISGIRAVHLRQPV